MTLGYFIAGTDTEIGKTAVACALLHRLRARHARVVGMKPVAAGAERRDGSWFNEDVAHLRAASSLAVDPALDNPYLFEEPVSPHIAAARAGRSVDIAHVVDCHRRLAGEADAVVVEGVGGFCAPLTPQHTAADLAQALDLPIILVVGMRLGCLNHALLTLEAIAARGLPLAGWVANTVDPAMRARADNLETLRRRIDAPLLADLPRLDPFDPSRVAIALPRNAS